MYSRSPNVAANPDGFRSVDRQAHDETRAKDLGSLVSIGGLGNAIFRPQPAAVGLDDLLGDRQAKPGILAEALMRPVGVEAIKNLVEGVRPDARPVVVDDDLDLVIAAGGR